MKIPKTTIDKPYIEFRIDKKGKIKLSASSIWWGGKNASFSSSDGTEGNTCEPKNLKSYIKAFKERKIKTIEKEILILQNNLRNLKDEINNWNF
jgi:hypothetical protein